MNAHMLKCQTCGFTIRRRPTIGVGVIVMDGNKVLLGRRGLRGWSKYMGYWCIPCGHLEWGEEIRRGARREFWEETGLEVEVGEVYAVHSNFHNPQELTVGVWFMGTVTSGTLVAGDDLDLAGYFDLSSLPELIAFPTDRLVLDKLKTEMA